MEVGLFRRKSGRSSSIIDPDSVCKLYSDLKLRIAASPDWALNSVAPSDTMLQNTDVLIGVVILPQDILALRRGIVLKLSIAHSYSEADYPSVETIGKFSVNTSTGAVLLAILGLVLYQVVQKQIPPTANPGLVLLVTYTLSGAICWLYVAAKLYPKREITASLAELNWTSLGLPIAIIAVELGFLLMYRTGWKVGLGSLVVNVAASMILVVVGILAFNERLSVVNILGIGLSIIGLTLLNLKTG